MVNSPKLVTKQCNTCISGILMLDGNTWCGITMKPESGAGCNYSPGSGKLYKPKPKVIQKEKVVAKTTPMPKIKTIPIKQKPIISSKKIIPPQPKLF